MKRRKRREGKGDPSDKNPGYIWPMRPADHRGLLHVKVNIKRDCSVEVDRIWPRHRLRVTHGFDRASIEPVGL